ASGDGTRANRESITCLALDVGRSRRFASPSCQDKIMRSTMPVMRSMPHRTPDQRSPERVPPLRTGDRLTRAEFERRYLAMPDAKKAELIEGVVYMPSPVSEEHAAPHFDLITWLGMYRMATEGIVGGDNGTLRLDLDNEPQPDAFLRILPEF